MTNQATKPIELFGGGDQRCVTLLDALVEVISERGEGIPFQAILGTIKLLEMTIIREQCEALNV